MKAVKTFLAAVPLPIAGVALGLAALGNLLQSYSEVLRLVLGTASGIIWLCLILKAILLWAGVLKALQDPIVASVSGTFPMTTMLLAVYIKPFVGPATARAIWFAGIILHIILILWFTQKFIFRLELSKVFASYFIVYVGIAVAALTSPAFEMTATIGTWTFWFSFISLVALLVIVTIRYIKFPVQKDPAKPIFCIYAAPISLCLTGYIQSITPKNAGMVIGLLAASTIVYLIVLSQLPSFLRLPFFPSYAAFTFPFVITAIAAKQSMVCLTNLGYQVPWLSPVILVETVIAICLVLYTLVCYLRAIGSACNT